MRAGDARRGGRGRLDISWEPLGRLIDDGAGQLARAHWQESGVDKEAIPLDIDYPRLLEIEARGEFKALAARLQGRLVGYNSFFIVRHLNYRTSLQAANHAIYVDPGARGYPGIRLILEAEIRLKAMGVEKIRYHSKEHVRLGGGVKDGAHDSLDALNGLMDLDLPPGAVVSDALMAKAAAGDATLGDLLQALGYYAEETLFSKVTKA